MATVTDPGVRGEYADRPTRIPRRGWLELLRRTWREVSLDNVSLLAAGVAFYAFLGIFPFVTTLLTVYGLLADQSDVSRQVQLLSGVVPEEVVAFATAQLQRVAAVDPTSLGLGFLVSAVLTLWSATKGVKALMTAINVAYEERERRGFILLNLTALGLTVGAMLFLIVALAALAAAPVIIGFVPVAPEVQQLVLVGRWVVVAILAVVALAMFYRIAPNRSAARMRWVLPGAVAAMVLWLIVSAGFSLYVANFANYNATFGSLGAIVTLLMWLYLSAFIVCIGAELNAELEHQTHADTTAGPARPEGRRGAWVADHTAGPA